MKKQNNRYLARFLAASRVALGLASPGDAEPATMQGAALHAPEAICPMTEMHLTASQRERVLAVLHTHVPVIRATMKVARRAQHQARRAPTAAVIEGAAAQFAADQRELEIVRLRAAAMREIRSILTPYQRVHLVTAKLMCKER